MYGYIYETTNIVNGRKYIGQHKSKVFDNSYYGSGIRITNAVKKYGKDNFKVVILEKCSNKEDLNEKEKYYIKQLKESGQKYYNISNGGDCAGSVYDYLDDNEIIKWKNNVSKRTKEAMIEKGLINKNGLSEEMRIKISKATKGIKKSEEMKLKLSNSTKGVPKPWCRKPKSEETKKKMSETCIIRNQIQNIIKNGTTNKGKKMINKNGTIKYVFESEIDKYINEGWNKGTCRKQDSKGQFI